MSILKAGSGNGGTGDGGAVSCSLVKRRLPGQRPCRVKGRGLGPGQGGVQVEGTVSVEETNTKMYNHRQSMCTVSTHVKNHIFLKVTETEIG